MPTERVMIYDLDSYKNIFMSYFLLEENQLDDLRYQSIDSWDSVGHMGMIAGLEDAFEIEMDTDDIIDFSGYEKGKEIMAKYKVEMS